MSDVTKPAARSKFEMPWPPMKRLLSHSQTKMQLTGFLRQKILEHASVKGRHVVVDFGT